MITNTLQIWMLLVCLGDPTSPSQAIAKCQEPTLHSTQQQCVIEARKTAQHLRTMVVQHANLKPTKGPIKLCIKMV